mmetsp:Transcript_32524/g.58230  ORF Transcript_32524/g.58230 Transcript_32524/m.58230 type:complete len:211 (-) Transcript_32524:308-940(-)
MRHLDMQGHPWMQTFLWGRVDSKLRHRLYEHKRSVKPHVGTPTLIVLRRRWFLEAVSEERTPCLKILMNHAVFSVHLLKILRRAQQLGSGTTHDVTGRWHMLDFHQPGGNAPELALLAVVARLLPTPYRDMAAKIRKQMALAEVDGGSGAWSALLSVILYWAVPSVEDAPLPGPFIRVLRRAHLVLSVLLCQLGVVEIHRSVREVLVILI